MELHGQLLKGLVRVLGGEDKGGRAITLYLKFKGLELFKKLMGDPHCVYEVIGKNGQKFVARYLANQQEEESNRFLQQLEKECEIHKALNRNAFVVTLLESFSYTSVFCVIIMEQCLGDLYDFVEFYPVFSESTAYSLDLISCICGAVLCALKHLNKQGFIHGDIKPAKILISQDLVPKLCDFGTTCNWRDSYTPGTYTYRFGTDCFMPEELHGGGKYFFDENLDSFALGMTMLRLLSTKFAYQERSVIIQNLIFCEFDVKGLLVPEVSVKRGEHTYPDGTVAHPRLWGDCVYAVHHMITKQDYRPTRTELCKFEFFSEMGTAWEIFQHRRGKNVLSATMDLSPTIVTRSYQDPANDHGRLYDFTFAHIVDLTVKLQEKLYSSFPDSSKRTREELEFMVVDFRSSTHVNHKINATKGSCTRILLRGICFLTCTFEELCTPLLATLCDTWMLATAANRRDDVIFSTYLLVVLDSLQIP